MLGAAERLQTNAVNILYSVTYDNKTNTHKVMPITIIIVVTTVFIVRYAVFSLAGGRGQK